MSCNKYTYSCSEAISITPESSLLASVQSYSLPQVTTDLISITIKQIYLPVLEPHINETIQPILFYLAAFARHNFSSISSLFILLSGIPLYDYTIICLSIHSLWMDIWVVSSHGLLEIKLLYEDSVQVFLWVFLLAKYQMCLLGPKLSVCLNL